MIDYGHGAVLEPVDSEDDDLLRHWRNDPEVWQWCRQVGLISDMDQAEWIDTQNDDPTIRMFKICDVSLTPVGVGGLTSIDLINRRAEFSLYIAPEEKGRGYGYQGLKSILCFGFRS